MLKSKIRKKILKVRKIKYNENIKINFNKIFYLIKKKINLKKKVIGGYYPVSHEINDLDILKKFEKKNIIISLPSIKKNFKMNFVQCSLENPFIINKYGIPEPSIGKIVYPDILLVPLVAFDKNLNRLGYGAGYYDRLIQSLKKKKILFRLDLHLIFKK